MKHSQSIFFLFLGSLLLLVSCNEKGGKLSPYASAELQLQSTKVKIKYSSPQRRNRTLWGELVPYGEVWRTGADEATIFETSKDIIIDGKTLTKGKYGLFTIPEKDGWTVIFNKTWDQWGAFNYEESQDALRAPAKSSMVEQSAEAMIFSLEKTGKTEATMKLQWGKVLVELPFEVSLPEE